MELELEIISQNEIFFREHLFIDEKWFVASLSYFTKDHHCFYFDKKKDFPLCSTFKEVDEMNAMVRTKMEVMRSNIRKMELAARETLDAGNHLVKFQQCFSTVTQNQVYQI